jgi:hypothetical protein
VLGEVGSLVFVHRVGRVADLLDGVGLVEHVPELPDERSAVGLARYVAQVVEYGLFEDRPEAGFACRSNHQVREATLAPWGGEELVRHCCDGSVIPAVVFVRRWEVPRSRGLRDGSVEERGPRRTQLPRLVQFGERSLQHRSSTLRRVLSSRGPTLRVLARVQISWATVTYRLKTPRFVRPSSGAIAWETPPTRSLVVRVNTPMHKVKEDGVHRNYRDCHKKVTVYVGRISGPAGALDPTATARRHRPLPAEDGDHGPFQYIDAASSRAGIDALNRKLAEEKVGIIGLGGTGEYILDYVSKTEVQEIHLFDGDPLFTHNAFRAPGAASFEQLDERPLKVHQFAEVYGNMRHGIVSRASRIDADNVAELHEMTFVFVDIDGRPGQGTDHQRP